ncbi:MAG: response regulator RpfG family c-di-GMP phosphodiesterase [Colwellia sp.]|jgi:response regulator RpfG family c-di-GMP phosphodiesterase
MKPVNILLLSDSQYEVKNTQKLLGADFGKISATTCEESARLLFKENRPALLILSYEHVGEALEFYLSLHDSVLKTTAIPHKVLLFCNNKGSETAYNLCKHDVIDDYIACRPLFDPFRLRLSVQQNIERYKQELRYAKNANNLEKITSDIQSLSVLAIEKLQKFVGEQIKSTEFLDHHSKELSQATKELQKNIKSLFSKNNNRKLGATIEKEILVFKEKSLDKPTLSLSQQLHSTQNKIEYLVNDFKFFLNNLDNSINKIKAIKVLVIDDDDMYREVVSSMLESDALNVSTFNCGHAAIEYLQSDTTDIILLDYNMPNINGLGVLRLLKASQELKEIPVVMLTGDSSKQIVVESIKAGAKGYIVKPSNRKILLDKINSIVNLQ